MGLLSFFRRQSAAPAQVQVADGFNAFQFANPFSRVVNDQIVNWMTGQGMANDPAMATRWLAAQTENWQSLVNLYRSSWIAKKVVRKKPMDMLRAGYSLIWEGSGEKNKGKKNTEADAVRAAVARWKADQLVVEATTWARLFGGSVIVIGKKGDLLRDPLPVKNGAVDYSGFGKGSLEFLQVYDRWRANYDGQIDGDKSSPNFGRPLYHILSTSEGLTGGQQVHWTRVLRFDGDLAPWWTWRANACWHDSVLQVLIDLLKQYDTTTGAITSLLPKARRDIIKAKNLTKNLASDPELVEARYAASMRMSSMYNVTLLDKELEEYEQQTYQFSGLDRIWEKSQKEVAGATDYPVSILFGDEPSGMNATGDVSERSYFNGLASERRMHVEPQHLIVLELITRNELGELPPGFSIQYNSFWPPTEKEQADISKTEADADNVRIQSGVITPGLAAREAKERSRYRTMTQEDVDLAEMSVSDVPENDNGENEPTAVTAEVATKGGSLNLTATAMASIVTVNQALAWVGLPPRTDADGELTVAEFQAKHSATVAAAVNAEAGNEEGGAA